MEKGKKQTEGKRREGRKERMQELEKEEWKESRNGPESKQLRKAGNVGSRVERSKERKDKNRTEITIAGTKQKKEVAGKERIKIGRK